jgi:hypothetical protein
VTCLKALISTNVLLIAYLTRMSSVPLFGAASPSELQVLS